MLEGISVFAKDSAKLRINPVGSDIGKGIDFGANIAAVEENPSYPSLCINNYQFI